MAHSFSPIFVRGKVVKGFGRGSKELGCPTANLESETVNRISLPNGIYYGFAQLRDSNKLEKGENKNQESDSFFPIYNMVSSFGTNPHYSNKERSFEVHILHQFASDFYGSELRVAVCGFIRDEQKFNSLDELIAAINNDIDVTKRSLADPDKWKSVTENQFFK